MRRLFVCLYLVMLHIAAAAAFSQSTEPTTPYVGTTDATAVTTTSAELHGALLPRGRATTSWFEWGTTTALGNQTEARSAGDGTAVVTFSQSISNLQPHTTYYFRAVGRNDTGTTRGDIRSFTTLSASSGPTVTTTDANGITSTSVVLNGTVNPLGRATTAWFEWGTSTASLPNRTDGQTMGDGVNVVTFRQPMSSLQPHTTYVFRAVARQGDDEPVRGPLRTFTTLSSTTTSTNPSIAASEASSITTSAATLNGIVNPAGTAVNVWFEWGSTTAMSNRSDTQSIASGTAAVTFRQTLSNLQTRTTYYFRAVVQRNDMTPIRSDVRSFTTSSSTTTTDGPSVGTADATAVASNSAELHGVINAPSTGTTVWFEWGNTTPFPNQTEARSVSGSGAVTFAQSISNLQANTAYYFRAVARVGTGEPVRGNVRTFTTARVTTETPRSIPEVEEGEIRSGYVIITPDTASAAPAPTATFGMVSGGNVQAQAGIVSAAMTTDASMFVEVIPTISRNIGVALVNPSSATNAITLTLRDDDGSIIGSPATVSVPARQQVAQFVNELFGSDAVGAGFRGSLRMQSTTPFAAIGLRFAGNVFSTLPVAALTTVPGVPSMGAGIGGTGSLILPQFAIAGGWATQIALVNNTNAAISGRVDIFDASGNPLPAKLNGETRSSFTYSIPIGGTFVLAPRDSNGQSAL